MGSGWGMGAIGGWVTNSGIAGAVIKGSATKAGGGRLGGTGAGFNTWANRNRADVATIPLGPKVFGGRIVQVEGARLSELDREIAFLSTQDFFEPTAERVIHRIQDTGGLPVTVMGPPLPQPPVMFCL